MTHSCSRCDVVLSGEAPTPDFFLALGICSVLTFSVVTCLGISSFLSLWTAQISPLCTMSLCESPHHPASHQAALCSLSLCECRSPAEPPWLWPPGKHCGRTFQLRESVKGHQGLLRTVTFGAFSISGFQTLTYQSGAHKQGQKRSRGKKECFGEDREAEKAACKSFRKHK